MNVNPNQETALESYFDALLFTDDGNAFEDAEEISPLFSLKETVQELPAEHESAVEIEQVGVSSNAEPLVDASNEEKSFVQTQPVAAQPVVAPEPEPVSEKNGCDVISQSMTEDGFLFIRPVSVVGLNLALPMDRVTDVLAYSDAGINLLGGRGTILGSMTYQDSEIVVLDTAEIIVPQTHSRRSAMLERKNYQNILVLDGGSLAIAVDAVDEEVYLPTDNIQWNPATSHYVWLAGTMTNYGYALINADKLSGYLM